MREMKKETKKNVKYVWFTKNFCCYLRVTKCRNLFLRKYLIYIYILSLETVTRCCHGIEPPIVVHF